jgi:hypothetical protein
MSSWFLLSAVHSTGDNPNLQLERFSLERLVIRHRR